ncbi:MAG TPA: hypothetical protein VFM86_03960 [Pedococcus sp.]|jgi:hypothetical protein|uniref:hypothetical protein n=1 Tax=Phycicoccus sp. 3266 TaxID=2817751 RepID=UPI002858CA27|nr:hypothetical protein [Phycicoccus sp. 3266]MDR6863205.1 hypothetical protein [Phycicoccus sp. 3266]HET8766460.1 hypothetical protein [Pedococcus sp.]
MPTLKYPSEQFPGPPSVTVDIPDGWSPVRVPGTLLAARRAEKGGAFAPNLVVRGFTRSAEFTIGRALAELKAFVQERPDGEMDDPFEVEIADVPFVGVNVSWTDEKVGDVVQAHLFAGARRGQVVDLIQVTGSVGGPEVESEYATVQELMQTVRVTR